MNSGFANKFVGTWISDNTRTLWELRRTLGPRHAKTIEYSFHAFPLLMNYSPDLVTYYYRDIICRARYRAVAEDEHSVMIEVEPSELNEQRLFHIHFVSASLYWVTVHTDWGLVYREYFERMFGDPGDEVRRIYATTPLFQKLSDKSDGQ